MTSNYSETSNSSISTTDTHQQLANDAIDLVQTARDYISDKQARNYIIDRVWTLLQRRALLTDSTGKLAAELAYELGYERGLEDLDTFYRDAYNIAADAAALIRNPDEYQKISDELEYLDLRYERARNAVTEHDGLGTLEGKAE